MSSKDSTPDGVADTLAATPSHDAPDPQLETLAVTADDVPEPTRRTSLPTVSRDAYRIDGEIGRGGMGRVLRARDLRVDRVVAIKEALSPSLDLAARFEREALITARLQHPAIIPVYECGQWPDGEPFYAMKLVAGKPLDRVIGGAEDFPARAALLPHIVAVCEALAYAHDRGVIHRDLKPGNVLCGDYGETVVVDWGLAKDLAAADAPVSEVAAAIGADMTRVGSAIGTPAYMAPEQARGEELDARADVYALGAMLYHLLAGAPPYHRSKSAQDVIDAVIAARPPVALAEHVPDAPPELIAIVERAMAPSIEARYPSAAELAADLRRFEAGQVVQAHRYTLGEMVRRWVRRHKAAIGVATAIVVALAVVAVVMVRQVLQARDAARAQRAALLAESGRLELVGGAPSRALPYLIEAWRAGRRDPALRLNLGEAARSVDEAERVLVHGGGRLVDVELARDGSAATLASDGSVKLWLPDGAPGAVIASGAETTAITLSEDGDLLAITGDRVRVFDARTGRALEPELPPVAFVLGNGGRLVTADTGRVRFYARNGDRLVEDPARATPGLGVAGFTRVDKPRDVIVLPEAEWPRAIAEIRDATTGGLIETVSIPGTAYVNLLDGWLLAASLLPTASDKQTDELWLITATELATGRRLTTRRFMGAPERMIALADGHVVIDANRGVLDLVDADGALERMRVAGGSIGMLARIDAGDGSLLVGLTDDTARLYDPGTLVEVGRLDGHAGAVTAVAVDPQHARVITGGQDGRAVIWRVTPRTITTGPGVSAVAPDGRWLRADGVTIELGGAGEARTLQGHTGRVIAIDAAWAADRAATLAADRSVRWWDLSGGRTLATIASDATAIALSPDGRLLAALTPRGIVVYDETGAQVVALAAEDDADLEGMTWSEAGQRLVYWPSRGRPRAWRDGDAQAMPSCDAEAAVARFAPTGDLLAIGTAAGVIVLCDATNGTTLGQLLGHADRVTSLAFTPDGRELVSGSLDRTARRWAVASRRTLVQIDHGRPITAVAVRDDGAVIATVAAPLTEVVMAGEAASPKEVAVWSAETGAPLWLRHGTGRALTFVPGGLAVQSEDLVIWSLPSEDRTIAAIDAGFERAGRWRLQAGGLVPSVVVPRSDGEHVSKIYDFSDELIEGDVLRPEVELPPAVTPNAAQQALREAWTRIEHDPAGAATASATIDGTQLATPDERYALSYLRFLSGSPDEALHWIRKAIETGGAGRPYLDALSRSLAASSVRGADAVAELQAAGASAEALIDLSDRLADEDRDDEADRVLDALPGTGASPLGIAMARERLGRRHLRYDRAVAAWVDALDTVAPTDPDRALVLQRVDDLAAVLHADYVTTRDRAIADGAQRLYAALLAAPDLGADPAAAARITYFASELEYSAADEPVMAVSTDLDKAMIRRAIKVRISGLRRCYERALMTLPGLQGTVRLHFRIDRSGRTSKIVADDGAPPPLTTCVTESAARWMFAATDVDQTDVNYPFVFAQTAEPAP